jgi:hypothetical protein
MNPWKRQTTARLFAFAVLTLLVTVSTDARAQAPAVDPAAVHIAPCGRTRRVDVCSPVHGPHMSGNCFNINRKK